MLRYVLIGLTVLVLAGAILFFGVFPGYVDRRANMALDPGPYDASAEARRLHDSLFVADLHDDVLLWDRDLLDRHEAGHTDVPRLVEANVGLEVFSVVTRVPAGRSEEGTSSDGFDLITLLYLAQLRPSQTWFSLKERALFQAARLREAADRDDRLVLIETRADLQHFLERRQQEPAQLAGLLALEGMHALEGDPAGIQALYDAGYRMMSPTHFFDNAVAGSAHGVERGGLTELGRQAIRRMEELGIIVDVAHLSPAAMQDVLDMATRPVVASHTGVKGTCEGPRNLSDEQIRHVAATGGVIGIGFWQGAVCARSVDSIVAAIRYTADRVGPEHVALGSDFDGTVYTPFDATGMVLITEGLLDAGFSHGEVAAIMGGNVRRVLLETLPRDRSAALSSRPP